MATLSAWAKSDADGGSLSLVRHLEDSAAVAGEVWDRWLPASTKARIASVLPQGEEDSRTLLRWLAGIHDIGKLSPAFACQVLPLAERMHDKGLRMPSTLANRKALPHSLAGEVEVERFLAARGWQAKVARTYAVIVGSHHGMPPTRGELRTAPGQGVLLGKGQWATSRDELLTYVTGLVDADERLDDWRDAALPVEVQVLLTAAVIVCDWIASNQDLFPLDSMRDSETAAVDAWHMLGLPSPWASASELTEDALFRARFDLAEGMRIRPLQQRCVWVAERMQPGVMIIEAPMGEGKTEAALMAAEVFARRFGFGGVFVALPTMATSNAMFARVHRWVDHLDDAPGSMFLAHGKAALNPEFAELKRRGFASIGTDCRDSGTTAHAWYVGKKGPLANIVVGTIDQILRAGLKTRHVMLRHLALVNKVVVIDEVHAADSYMSTYLVRVLEWLGAYGVPVLLLSATLPPAQRVALVNAYQRGKTGGQVETVVVEPATYPSITAWPFAQSPCAVEPSSRSQTVRIERVGDDTSDIVELLRTRLAEGGVAAVVCNTVGRAQAMFTALCESGDFEASELMLLHSRFVATQRTVLEDRLRKLLGPPGEAVRPAGKFVVVGTQVIEQSLDIDVDVMVTDLAPVDLVLQRIGRLHRHDRRDRPALVSQARCFLRGAQWSEVPPTLDSGSAAIYGPSRLLRAAALLADEADRTIDLPAAVPGLVAAAYASDFGAPTGWEEAIVEADAAWERAEEKRRAKASTYLLPKPYGESPDLLNWLAAAVPEDSDGVGGQAQVRDGEDSIEAIIVQRTDGEVRVLESVPEHGGKAIPTEGSPSAALAKVVAACTIRLPTTLTRYGRTGAVIDALENTFYPGWQQSPWLAGELILELDAAGEAVVAGYLLRYDRVLGLTIKKSETA